MDKTFVKGLNLIEVLAVSQEPRGVTSLSREIGLTKSNVHRLLTTLASRGYVRRIDGNSNYELTSKIWELGVLVRSRMDLVKVSRQAMAALADSTGEAVHLSALDGYEVLYLDKIESRQPIAAYTRVGGRAPAWAVATGKAMLAHTVSGAGVLASSLERFTPATLANVASLDREFATIRVQGYAVNRGEWREGVFGIAAPVWDATGQVVGAIGISGPGTRFKPRQIKPWAAAVVAAAASISRALGGSAGHG